jgi:uncharacterized membrane protein
MAALMAELKKVYFSFGHSLLRKRMKFDKKGVFILHINLCLEKKVMILWNEKSYRRKHIEKKQKRKVNYREKDSVFWLFREMGKRETTTVR